MLWNLRVPVAVHMPSTQGSGNTKAYPGADIKLAGSTRKKSISPSNVCIVSVVSGSGTFLLTKAIRPGGQSRNLGARTASAHTAHSMTASTVAYCHQSTEATWGGRTKFCITQPSELPFHPRWTYKCTVSKPKGSISAESLAYQKLSGYWRHPMKIHFAQWDNSGCDTVTVDMWRTIVQPHRMCNAKSELQCKLWTWGDDDISA